jgi:hypothetical protein
MSIKNRFVCEGALPSDLKFKSKSSDGWGQVQLHIRRIFILLALSIQVLGGAAVAQQGFAWGNAVCRGPIRYVDPNGTVDPGTNPPPTGPGTALLPPSQFDNASGVAVASFGSSAAGPSVSATANISFDQQFSSSGCHAEVNYTFRVVGDASLAGQPGLLNLTAMGATTISGANGDGNIILVFDDITANQRLLTAQVQWGCNNGSCFNSATGFPGPTGFAFDLSRISVPINHSINVFLGASASQRSTGSFQAKVDPVITLDPSAPAGLVVVFDDPRIQQPAPVNLLPTANAGPGQLIHAGSIVNLSGTSSFDDNTPSNALGYAWSFVSRAPGSTATLTNANTATPSFVADKSGTYVVQLIVTDTGSPPLASQASTVTISSLNQPPTANAGPDQVALANYPVSLNGAGSADPDHDPISYAWAITIAPAGSVATINGPATATPNFTPFVPGTYTLTLGVSDPYGPGTPDTVKITVDTATDYVAQEIACATTVIGGLTPSQVTSQGNKKDLLKLLGNAVADKRGEHQDADDDSGDRRDASESGDHFNARTSIKKLDQAINRTDGCPLRGTPDAKGQWRDWITYCPAQTQVYACLTEAVRVLKLVP